MGLRGACSRCCHLHHAFPIRILLNLHILKHLAYIVDANNGRSSSAVATNSCFRGIFAFVAAEVAIPLQDTIGDGGMYSLWGGIMVVSELLILLVWWKGGEWREKWEAR
ncbi:hypothetical protein A0H81_08577 [Grifola frondosa]|uniref:Uncharacterized protein n=1 Tax=Grifola frondosa TaxID=5627 RepID=A0A1C7M488_GRIFR|nr:hypothetical protein A0H81_08577 [Grifola frondosa]